jgi:hypothetical protein
VWIAGLMALFDIRLRPYNVIVIPVVLGVGIDGAIHLYHRYRSVRCLRRLMRTTGLTVTASSWTNAAGFVGLQFVARAKRWPAFHHSGRTLATRRRDACSARQGIRVGRCRQNA